MKLNLVADYDIMGKRFVSLFQIDGSANLVNLPEMTKMQLHFSDGGHVWLSPLSLLMCETRRKAERVRRMWMDDYRKDGRLCDFSPLFRDEYLAYVARKEGRADA